MHMHMYLRSRSQSKPLNVNPLGDIGDQHELVQFGSGPINHSQVGENFFLQNARSPLLLYS